MPNMFSRRRASSAQPPVDRATTQNATTAAAQAFLARPSSQQGQLSSSAAAAALRSHTTSPEPVGNIQTKRMVRRSSQNSVNSASVIGSPGRGGMGRGGLIRQNSASSMTERTFRSPSPSNARNGAMSPSFTDAPPVPKPSANAKRTNRSSSVEPPARVISPTPTKGHRGVSVDRGNSVTAASTTPRQRKRLSDLPELERDESSNAVNSSKKQRAPRDSSPVGTTTTRKSSWFSGAEGTAAPKVRSATSDGALTQAKVLPAGNKSAGKKQRSAQSGEGSHLGKASRPSDVGGASYDEDDTVMVYDANSRSFITKPRNSQSNVPPSPDSPSVAETVTTYDPSSRTVVTKPRATRAYSDATASASDSEAPPVLIQKQRKKRPEVTPLETDIEPPPRNPARVSSGSPTSPLGQSLANKAPSIVEEEPEEEEEAEVASMPAQITPKASNRSVSNTVGPPKSYIQPTATHQRSVSLDVPRSPDGSARGRNNSSSPSRSLHFSSNPIIGGMRHVPPPRSISPQKSAMKQQHSPGSSVRTVSPMANFSPPAPKAPPSDTSETNSLDSQDLLGPKKKKKSARVSFNDKPPEVLSPPGDSKRTAREISPAVDDDMDEVMQPRPALPSFGSVRKNGRPEMAEKVTEQPPDRHAQEQHNSSDHIVGGILANHHAKQQEHEDRPLPPDVTSKRGTGDITDESDDAFEPNAASTPAQVLEIADSGKAGVEDYETGPNGEVPDINLQPPTPGLDDDDRDLTLDDDATGTIDSRHADPPAEAVEVVEPSMPETAEEEKTAVPPTPVEVPSPIAATTSTQEANPVSVPQPATVSGDRWRYSVPGGWDEPEEGAGKTGPEIATPDASRQPSTSETYTAPSPAQERALDSIMDESDDSEDSAMFSDAEEDLSYLDDGGFASLDAIVESPVVNAPYSEEPDNSPSRRLSNKIAQKTAMDNDKPPSSNDWSEATAYWSKLSRQQKLQIEREALSSDDDLRPPPVVRKTSKKKTRKSTDGPSKTAVARDEDEYEHAPAPAPAPRKTEAKTTNTQPRTSSMRSSMRGPPSEQPQSQQDDGEVHIRKSMRSGGGAPRQRMQRTLSNDSSGSRPAPQKNARPQSAGQLTSSGLPASAMGNAMLQNQRKSQPPPAKPKSMRAPAAPAPKPAPAVNNDSDSESSFRKNRTKRRPSNATSEAQGRYSMKRSMRGESAAPPMPEQRPTSPNPATRGKSAWSIRSLSPTGSTAGRNRENLRQSMRGNSVDASDSRSLRGAPPPRSESKSRFSSFGRSSRSQPPPAAAPSKPRFSSRFGNDSDDEKDNKARGGRFKSRFADSDEENDAAPSAPSPLPPVRGIPRPQGQDDGDSTELSDEENENDDPKKSSRRRQKQAKPGVPDPADVEKAMAIARRNLGMSEEQASVSGTAAPSRTGSNKGTEGKALGKGSLRNAAADEPEEEEEDQPMPMAAKRRGFMGSILRRNRGSSTNSIPQLPQQQQQDAPASPSGGHLTRRASHARTSSMTNNPKPYDLQPDFAAKSKKNTSAAAPRPDLPEPRSSYSRQRPATSGGLGGGGNDNVKMARTMRPEGLGRSVSGYGAYDAGGVEGEREEQAVYSEKTGKKKKFGRLRKVFGLND